jgi:Ca2+-binding RTX toxin-like protein
MKNFDIAASDVQFLQEQVSTPLLRVVGYDPIDGSAIYGFTRPAGSTFGAEGDVVTLGKLGAFDLFDPDFPPALEWASYIPGNSPGVIVNNVTSGFGLRNVAGLFNSLANPSSYDWGAIGNPFSRLSNSDYSKYIQQDATTLGSLQTLYGITGQVDSSTLYANPFATVRDYTPRMISQLVNSSVAGSVNGVAVQSAMDRIEALAPGTVTDHQDYTKLVNGVATTFTENFQRNINTLGGDPSLTGWQVLFGQFFDHGLDSIGKGGNRPAPGAPGSKIIVQLAPDDPLYNIDPLKGPIVTTLSISRATVSNAQQAGADGMFRTNDDIISAGADGIYGVNPVTGTSDDVLGLANPEYINHVSPYIDQSQTYGSDDNVTNLLREWVIDPTTGQYVQGMKLFSGASLQQSWTRINPITGVAEETHATLPTLSELRAHLLATGRDDLTWEDISNFRARDSHGKVVDRDGDATNGIQAISTGSPLLLDMLNRLDAAHLLADPFAGVAGHINVLSTFDATHIDRGADTSSITGTYISDYINLQSGRPTALGTDPANGAILNEILLRSVGDHYIAGDGRVNENFGLTAVHHVWHEDHNWQIDNLIASVNEQQAADPTHTVAHGWQKAVTATGFDPALLPAGITIVNGHFEDAKGNYVTSTGTVTWNQEKMFQAATLIVQMEYQHVAIDQYARGMTPNIPLFVQYDSSVNADVTLEYSQGAYRFGHSQLRETIDVLDSNGSLSGMVTKFALEQAFLNPSKFGEVGPTAIVQGMTRQVSSEIDEILTPSLQQALLGQPQDLAAINIMRGRDLGLPTLNTLRRSLSGGLDSDIANLQAQLVTHPGDATLQKKLDQTIGLQQGLTAYTSWADYGNHLVHPESIINFLAAYAFGGSAGSLDKASMIYKLGSTGADIATLSTAEVSAYTTLGWTEANAVTNAKTFLGETSTSNKTFENIDAWVGGLAEKHVFLGQLGSTFDAIFCDQMTRLMNGDRFYYFWRLQLGLPEFTQLSSSVSTEQFKDVIERTTGAQHLTGDVFLMTDSHIELGEDPTLAANANATVDAAPHRYGDLVTANTTTANADGTIGLGVHSGGTSNPGAIGEYNVADFANHLHVLSDGSIFRDTVVGGHRTYISDFRPNTGTNPDGTAQYGFDSHETIAGTKFGDYIDAGDGDDTAYGEEGNDILVGNAGADHLYGENGDDSLFGGDLPDFLDGGNGNDEIHGGNDADVLIGAGGNDTIYGENFTDELHGNSGDDYLDGGLDADFIYGGYGCDIILGQEGLDTTYGEWGDDQMFGGAGPDQLFGGQGDDILHGGAGSNNRNLNVDECLGEEGFNMASYNDLAIKLDVIGDLNFQNVNPVGTTALQAEPFGQLLVNIQSFEGTGFADQFIGDGFANWLIGGGGNDIMSGGGGDDVIVGDRIRLDALDGSYNAAGVLGQGLLDIVPAGGGKHFTDLLKSYRDFLFGRDTGAIGTSDIVTYSGAVSQYIITIVKDGAGAVINDANGNPMLRIVDTRGIDTTTVGDLVIGVDKLVFGYDFEAVATAGNKAHTFINPLSLPTATTFNVNQFYTDQPGTLTITATPSTATANLAAVVVDLNAVINLTYQWYSSTDGGATSTAISGATTANIATISNSLTRLIANYSDVFGAKTLTSQWVQVGDGNANSINGTTGADLLMGLDGGDTYTVNDVGDIVTELGAGTGTDTVLSSLVAYTLATNVENLTLIGAISVTGIGNSDANVITGNGLDNTLDGGAGNDSLIGGAGNDALIGGSGDDSLDGSSGNDTMKGGLGDDTYLVDSATDVVTETALAGTDTVISTVSLTLAINAENLTMGGTATIGMGNTGDNVITGNAVGNNLNGGVGNDTLFGNDGADVLSGLNGDDSLDGGDGADYLYGGAGNDTVFGGTGVANDVLYGGAGADVLDGGLGNDYASYYDFVGANLVVNLLNIGLNTGDAAGDTYTSIEWLQGSQNANNSLTGNNSSNNLYGYNGNDTLDGAGGNDLLTGAGGNDTYIVDSSGDVISEAAGAGIDTVLSTATTYALSANIESLTLLGTAANGTGNISDNTIIGNTAINILTGGDGNDTISGNDGNDYLYGGNGIDSLDGGNGTDYLYGNAGNDALYGGIGVTTDVLYGGAGADILNGGDGSDYASYYDFIGANLVVNLLNTTLNTGDAAGDTYTSIEYLQGSLNANNSLTGDTLANNISSFNGSDTLYGDDGNDSLSGGSGVDSLDGGNGVDYLYGNAGNDSLYGGVGVTTDVLYGGAGADILNGGDGNDYASYYDYGVLGSNLVVNLLNTTLNTGDAIGDIYTSIEWLQGSLNANNNLTGDNANNNLYGYNGNDTLNGADGTDVLSAGGGNDLLRGGAGSDVLITSTGNDQVEFSGGVIATTIAALLGTDTISDFAVGVDKLVLSRTTFAGLNLLPGSTLNASDFAIVTGATDTLAATSAALIIYNSTNGHLLFNQNGIAANYGTGGQFATLSNFATLGTLNVTDIALIA